MGMLPLALQANLAKAKITAAQNGGQAADDVVSECEDMIERIASSIKNTHISNEFARAARTNLAA
ncbi:MAG: hypothetical protein O3B95_12305 [Chloroflexi bacterium]|nr:hypothetical protein [Chloroflexota bacterium]